MTESPSEQELIRTSEAGKFEDIRRLFQKHVFSIEIIDKAIRKCLNKLVLNQNYEESIKLLFSYGNLNYLNPNEENSNILMELCSRGNKTIINKLLDGKYLTRNKIIIEVDLFKVDINKCNILHYLIKSQKFQENEAMIVFENFMNYINNINQNKIKSNKNNDKLEFLSQPDNKGITPLILILQKGWAKFLNKYLEFVDYKKYIVPLTNNNLIHYAIDSKKINCVKKILSYSTSEDLKYNNKFGYSPAIYAQTKNYNYMAKLIEETEKNFDKTELKNILISPYITFTQVIKDFMDIKFNIVLYYLLQYKILFSIDDENDKNFGFEWNKFITEYNILIMCEEKKYHKEKVNLINCIDEIGKFFNKHSIENKLKTYMSESNSIIDILIYNKIIFYIKINDWDSAIKNINLFFNSINFQNKKNIFLKKNLLINITFILIEYCINFNNIQISFYLIESLEKFLKQNNNYKTDSNNIFNNELIIDYLNNKEIFNLFKSSSNDIFIYLYLVKSYLNIKNKILSEIHNDNIHNIKNIKIKIYFKDFKIKLDKNKGEKSLPILNKIKIIYMTMKSKLHFLLNHQIKSFNKISLVNQSNYGNLIEYKLYYYNSMGILNLSLKDYNLSEYYFKFGIRIFKAFSKNKKNIFKKCVKRDDTLINRLDFLYKLKYNLGLCLFYQKKFKESYDIFENLAKMPMFQNNIFLLYRFGLCGLQLYIFSLRNNYKEKSSIFRDKEIKYLQKKKNNDKSELDNLNSHGSGSFNFNNNDELYNQFEEEYGQKKENENIHLFQNSKIFLINKRNNNRTCFNLNLIYLQQSIKIFKKIIKIFKIKNIFKKYNENENNNKINDYKNVYLFYNKNINSKNNTNDSNLFNNDFKLPKSLFLSTFLNLLFAYSLLNKWCDILFEIKWFKNIVNKELSFNRNNNDVLTKVNYYKLLALINLNNINNTKNFIDTELKVNNNNINNTIVYLFNNDNGNLEKNITHNNYISCAEIIIDCRQKKFSEAEKKAKKLMIDNLYKYKKFSKYYSELYIYTLLLQNKKEQALSLIKYKNIHDLK